MQNIDDKAFTDKKEILEQLEGKLNETCYSIEDLLMVKHSIKIIAGETDVETERVFSEFMDEHADFEGQIVKYDCSYMVVNNRIVVIIEYTYDALRDEEKRAEYEEKLAHVLELEKEIAVLKHGDTTTGRDEDEMYK